MDRPRRDSRQHNGITVRGLPQPTFATKSAISGRRRFNQLRGAFGDIAGYSGTESALRAIATVKDMEPFMPALLSRASATGVLIMRSPALPLGSSQIPSQSTAMIIRLFR
jgi:hypothetical protein